MSVATLLLALLLQVTCSEAIVMECVEDLPSFERNQNLQENSIITRNLALIPGFKFACYGRINRWGVFMRQHETTLDAHVAYNIDFQVWRPERDGIEVLNCYHFVGSNYFQGFYTETSGRFTADIPQDQQIEVQPFDIIGLKVSDRMQINKLSIGVNMWYSRTMLTLVPSSTTVCLEIIPDPDSNQDIYLPHTNQHKPLITAVVDTTNTSQAPRTVESPTNHPTVTMDPATTDTQPSTASNPVTTDTSQTTTANTDTVTSNPATETEYPSTINTSPTPPSGLGTEGAIGISISIVGVLLLTLIALLVIVLACYRLRRKVLNQQVGVARPLPPIPLNRDDSLQTRLIDVEHTDNEGSDHRREDLYMRRNLAYNTQGSPAVVNSVNDDNLDDDGYERIPIPVCGPYEQLQYSQ